MSAKKDNPKKKEKNRKRLLKRLINLLRIERRRKKLLHERHRLETGKGYLKDHISEKLKDPSAN